MGAVHALPARRTSGNSFITIYKYRQERGAGLIGDSLAEV